VVKQPADASLRLNLGLVHLKTGAVDAAIVELDHARELDPSQMRTVGYLGLAYARKGRFSEAREAFLLAGQEDLAREMDQSIAAAAAGSAPQPAPEPTAPTNGEAEFSVSNAVTAVSSSPAVVAAAVVSASEVGAVEEPMEAIGSVTAAVHAAMPPPVPTSSNAGHQAPVSVSTFATERLVRPDDGDLPFEIAAGNTLIVRVRGRVLSRTEGVVVSGGELAYEAATKRVRGKSTDEPFGTDARPMFFVSGQGHLVAVPRGGEFTAMQLADDVVYLREDLVFAFEERLGWENGHVPGSSGQIPVVQLRGEGCVAIRTKRPPLSVKLAPDRTLYVDAASLAGWIGRVVPRVVAPAAGGESSAPFVECTGEGVVLLDTKDDAAAEKS
jgi:uncharacterized protein (AIM24 family)